MNLIQVTIPSIDLEKSVRFYQKLGLQLIVDSIPRYARFVCPDGNATFSIHRVEKLAVGEGVTVYFECENLDIEYNRLIAEGVEFIHPPIDQTWLWKEARLKDPDGNNIILFYGGENRVNPPWRIK
tara:strand:- start:392 stop:769 length:378 start_codon:yes stop_codon:yes gene_type:complete